jgi:hypothetical protein
VVCETQHDQTVSSQSTPEPMRTLAVSVGRLGFVNGEGLGVTDAHWWARVVHARTRHDDMLSQRVWTLHRDGREAAIDLRAVPGVGAEIVLAVQEANTSRCSSSRTSAACCTCSNYGRASITCSPPC